MPHDEDIAREAVAKWMIAHSYPTGHGDTLNDLLLELIGHVIKRQVIKPLQPAEQKQ